MGGIGRESFWALGFRLRASGLSLLTFCQDHPSKAGFLGRYLSCARTLEAGAFKAEIPLGSKLAPSRRGLARSWYRI